MSDKSTRLALITAVLVFVGTAGGAWFAYRAAKNAEAKHAIEAKAAPKPAPADDSITQEDERVKYVEASISVSDLAIGPDLKPGDDAGVVAGLLRVSGTVTNKGDKGVRTVRVVVNLQDKDDKVIGTYLEDALGGKRLGPGESRPFKFVVPDKKEFSGRFLSSVR